MATDRGAGTVLVVDDDRDIAEVVRLILTDEGYRVSILPSGDPALIRMAVNRLEPGGPGPAAAPSPPASPGSSGSRSTSTS